MGYPGIVEQRNEVLESRYFRLELLPHAESSLTWVAGVDRPNYPQCTCLRAPAPSRAMTYPLAQRDPGNFDVANGLRAIEN